MSIGPSFFGAPTTTLPSLGAGTAGGFGVGLAGLAPGQALAASGALSELVFTVASITGAQLFPGIGVMARQINMARMKPQPLEKQVKMKPPNLDPLWSYGEDGALYG
ncbi:MAG: hypothetical protein AB7P76_01990 [Candidatus Melainabacteria bacterium]